MRLVLCALMSTAFLFFILQRERKEAQAKVHITTPSFSATTPFPLRGNLLIVFFRHPLHYLQVLNRFEGAEENLVYLSVATMQMDAVLAKEPPVRDMHDFYALAGACLLLTSKYVGTRSLHAESLARFMRVSSKEHLMYMEQQVLRILDWRLQMPTPYDFINIFHYGMVLSHPLSADKARDLILRAFAISDFCCSGQRLFSFFDVICPLFLADAPFLFCDSSLCSQT